MNRKTRRHAGKDEVFKSYTVFSLSGLVPPFVILKMKQIESSGIINWWTDLLSREVTSDSGDLFISRFQEPTMDGNIITIFVVLLAGNAFSIIVFVSELLNILCNKCKIAICVKY